MMLSGCLITVIPLALAIGYMKFDPKIMPYLGIWAVNNLVFVAFAGEVLFRGMIRGACLPIRTIGLAPSLCDYDHGNPVRHAALLH